MTTPPGNKAFEPRFCFCNFKKCTRCGQCSRTYYCDSFLDRDTASGSILTPLMDTRNCSGCGLCVQICPKEALHLYPPREMVVLISCSEDQQGLLRANEIPFLSYDHPRDLHRFSTETQKITDQITPKTTHQEFNGFLEEIWTIRLQNKFILSEGAEDLYPELREERKKGCLDTAGALLDLSTNKRLPENCSNALARAALWSQLIWSDPGQVLWDCFILTVEPFIEKLTNNLWQANEQPTIDTLNVDQFQQDATYRMSAFVILLRQGSIILSKSVSSSEFQFSRKIFGNPEAVDAYNKQGMGSGRLGGLDLRCCGEFLVHDFSRKSQVDRHAMAGMPWPQICELLYKNNDATCTDDFHALCQAIRKRTLIR